MPNHKHASGFTLTELAIVLVIVALLLSTLMPALSAQLDQRNYSETRQTLSEVREALIGFAAKSAATADGRPYLPCPDTNDDGVEDRGAGGACIGNEGYLPWSDLGLARTDSWDNRVRYRVHAGFSSNVNGFTLTTAPDLRVLVAGGGITVATNLPVVLVSHGRNGLGARNTLPGWNTAPTGTDELENTDNDTDYVSHEQTPDFDDLVVWLPASLLTSRMISAGRLP